MRLDPKALRDKTGLCLGPDPDVVSEAIVLLASLIDSMEDINKSAPPTVSRKGDKPAAQSSAIGVLKQSISRLSGRPNLKAVEDIAKVVLDLHESAQDLAVAVKNARTPSEWSREWGNRYFRAIKKVSNPISQRPLTRRIIPPRWTFQARLHIVYISRFSRTVPPQWPALVGSF